MESEIVSVGGSSDTGGVGTGSASSLESNTQDSGASNVAPVDNSQGGGQVAPADEGIVPDEGYITDEDGKQYIPKEAFEARIAKLTSQKNEARQLLETIKNDPVVRKEFLDSLNIGEQGTNSSEESNEPTPFEAFLAPMQPEHQAHYRNMAKAMASEFTGYVQNYVKKEMEPLMSWVADEKIKNFSQTNKDFGKYQRNAFEIMKSGRASNIEDAYKLASFEDKIKSVFNAGQNEEVARRNKLSKVPTAGQSSGGVNTRNSKPMSLRDALNKAGSEHGYVN